MYESGITRVEENPNEPWAIEELDDQTVWSVSLWRTYAEDGTKLSDMRYMYNCIYAFRYILCWNYRTITMYNGKATRYSVLLKSAQFQLNRNIICIYCRAVSIWKKYDGEYQIWRASQSYCQP